MNTTKRTYPRWRRGTTWSQLYYIHSHLWLYEVHRGPRDSPLRYSALGPKNFELHFATEEEAKKACEEHYALHGYPADL